jgi:predicted transcriptional regulator
LEGLVKLARKKKDVEGQKNQMAIVHAILAIERMNINKTHLIKTLHLAIEINQALIERFVDIGASMSIMATNVVRELGIMHLVVGHET